MSAARETPRHEPWQDVEKLADKLDQDMGFSDPREAWNTSEVRREAVERLRDLLGEDADDARRKLVTMALMRESIPATSYADRHVTRFADHDHGRVLTYALHHAWVDETLHTKFVFRAASRFKRGPARLTGAAFGLVAAYMHGQPSGPVARALETVIEVIADLPRVQGQALRTLKRVKDGSYFRTAAELEYAAALGWRVINEIDVACNDAARAGWVETPKALNQHDLVLRNQASGITVADIARCARAITGAEINHTKTFTIFADELRNASTGSRTSRDRLVRRLTSVDRAYVPPELRFPRVPKRRPTVLQAKSLDELLPRLAACTPSSPSRVCVIADRQNSPALQRVVHWLSSLPGVQEVSILGAEPVGSPAAKEHYCPWPSWETEDTVHKHEAGCVFPRWPKVWAAANLRVTVATADGRKRNSRPPTFTLTLAALKRLLTGVPKELQPGWMQRKVHWARRSLARGGRRSVGRALAASDARVHTLISLLDQDPPHLSVVSVEGRDDIKAVGGDNPFRVDMWVNDNVVHWQPCLALQQALRLFEPDGGAAPRQQEEERRVRRALHRRPALRRQASSEPTVGAGRSKLT